MDATRLPPSGDWILTHTGKKFYPLDPRPEAICLEDIAHALARLCRWTGHTAVHYSVAQHAVHVALAVEQIAPDLALLALHHDDAEAYLGDISRPWKRNLFTLDEHGTPVPIERAEERVRAEILASLGLAWPAYADEVIRVADDRVLQAEAEELMPAHPEFPRFGIRPPSSRFIQRIAPWEAEQDFLRQHERLSRLIA